MIKKAIAMHRNFSLLSAPRQARLRCSENHQCFGQLKQDKCASLVTDHRHSLCFRQPCITETKAGHS